MLDANLILSTGGKTGGAVAAGNGERGACEVVFGGAGQLHIGDGDAGIDQYRCTDQRAVGCRILTFDKGIDRCHIQVVDHRSIVGLEDGDRHRPGRRGPSIGRADLCADVANTRVGIPGAVRATHGKTARRAEIAGDRYETQLVVAIGKLKHNRRGIVDGGRHIDPSAAVQGVLPTPFGRRVRRIAGNGQGGLAGRRIATASDRGLVVGDVAITETGGDDGGDRGAGRVGRILGHGQGMRSREAGRIVDIGDTGRQRHGIAAIGIAR